MKDKSSNKDRKTLWYGGPPEQLMGRKPRKRTPEPPNNPVILYSSPVTNPDYAPVTNQLQKTLIIKDQNLQGGFAQVPSVVVRDPRLSANAVRLYTLLLSYAWGNQQCFPGQNRLAADMGCNLSTVTRTLAELNEQCLISWKRQGLGLTNIYYIERLSDGYLTHRGNADGG